MEKLREAGASVSYSDPHIPSFPEMREHTFDLSSVELNADSIASYDCVLLATDHDSFDYSLISECASLIVDTRGRYLEKKPNVVRS
jgi:UDP-N-acetyl-D-glucosamine dehydrogenase